MPPLLPSPILHDPNSPKTLASTVNITPEQLSVISRIACASIGSQGTVGGLVVAGLVSKKKQEKLILKTN